MAAGACVFIIASICICVCEPKTVVLWHNCRRCVSILSGFLRNNGNVGPLTRTLSTRSSDKETAETLLQLYTLFWKFDGRFSFFLFWCPGVID
jgi:hypothetical protein